MKKISDVIDNRTKLAPLKDFGQEMPWVDEGNFTKKFGNKVYIKHLYGPLFFGFASRFGEMMNALPEVKIVIIRMDKVPYVDQSGMYAMEDAILDLQALGVTTVFVDIHEQPYSRFEQIKLIPNLIPKERIFKDLDECSLWLEDHFNTVLVDEEEVIS